MRKIAVIAFMFVLCAGLATAQIPTSGNVFFGYSYLNSGLSSLDRANANGWEGSLEGRVFPHVGLVADFSGITGRRTSIARWFLERFARSTRM